MNVNVYVNGKKISFGSEFGWFSGQEWKLIEFSLFYKMGGTPTLYIFGLQILKFNIGLWVDWEERI